MTYYYLLYFFLAVGAKLILAAVMIYCLLPSDPRCDLCDEDTLLLRVAGLRRVGSALMLGRVQWRWCPRCGWEGPARRVSGQPPQRDASVPSPTPTRH